MAKVHAGYEDELPTVIDAWNMADFEPMPGEILTEITKSTWTWDQQEVAKGNRSASERALDWGATLRGSIGTISEKHKGRNPKGASAAWAAVRADVKADASNKI